MARTDPNILQAATSFAATIGGEPVSVRRGDLIDGDHPLVKLFPTYFEAVAVLHKSPAKAKDPAVESATAGPGEKRGE